MELSNRVAIVTGASGGLGRPIAVRLAAQGAAVVVHFRGNQASAEEVVSEIAGASGTAVAVQGDVAKAADVDALVQAVLTRFGRVDILVNNAGITRDTLLMRMSEEQWDAVLDTNLKGAYLCTRVVLRPMVKQRWGRIINVSSIVGLKGNAGQANYAAAKAGLIGLTKSVAREVASRGITVNAVAPGYFVTPMTAALPPEIAQRALEAIPVGRFGQPEEVADAVVFLASERASYITGQVLGIDGGLGMA